MSSAVRFGRRVALPSTAQIIHELRVFGAAESIKALEKELQSVSAPQPAAVAPSPAKPASA